jgi:N-acetylmuramate 1-kinase
MDDRSRQIETFLEANGWSGARRAILAADASFRRYDRIRLGSRRAVLMDAPPDKEDIIPFLRVARHLRRLGYSAPEILAEDTARGLLLLEDFGDDTYTRLLGRGADEAALYRLAIDLLIDLHSRPARDAAPDGLPHYDDALFLDEAMLLVDWYLPAVSTDTADDDTRSAFGACWAGLLPAARLVPETMVLRDYHVDNLIRLEDRAGVSACGLLDFQDAVVGPASYDVVSLLEDARRDIPDALTAALRARYLDAFPALDRDDFVASLAILGAQRHCKVIGIFTRLCVRDGKPQYLQHIPRVWRLLEKSVTHPALDPLRNWLDTHIPPDRRIVPPAAPAPAP